MAQKFCQSCGTPMNENEMFCPNCGAKTEAAASTAPQAVQPAQPVPQQTPEMSAIPQGIPNSDGSINAAKGTSALAGKKNLIIIAAAAVVAIIVVVVVLTQVVFKYQTIDAQDLVKVTFNGIDGKGTASAAFNIDTTEYDSENDKETTVKGSDYLCDDKDRLLDAYTKAKSKSDAKDMRDTIVHQNKNGEYDVTFELSDDKDLSNGDTITVTVEYDEDELKDAGIKLKNTEFEISVEDLVTAESVDIFSYANVEFSGNDGNGDMDVDEADSMPEEFDDVVSFSYDGSAYYLSNGDTVTITAYIYSEYYVDDNPTIIKVGDKYYDLGMDVSELKKEVTVSGLKELTEVDVFADALIKFRKGSDGKYEIDTVDKSACSQEIQDYVYFDYDYGTVYAIGDTVTVTASTYSDFANAGYKIKGTANSNGEYEYTFTLTEEMVPVLVTKAPSASEFSGDAIATIDALYKADIDSLTENYIDGSYFGISLDGDIKSFSDFTLQKSYLRVADDIDESSNYNDNADIIRIYKTTLTLDGADSKNVYVIIRYNNLVKQGDVYSTTSTYGNIDVRTSMDDIKEDILNIKGFSSTEIK